MDLFTRTIRMLALACAGGVLSLSGEGADGQDQAQGHEKHDGDSRVARDELPRPPKAPSIATR
jgi:hypothetical protein